MSRENKLGLVSQKSRNFSGSLRATSFSLYLQNEDVSRHETLPLFSFSFPLQLMKRAASPNKRVGVYEWLYGPEKNSGLSRNGSQDRLKSAKIHSTYTIHTW